MTGQDRYLNDNDCSSSRHLNSRFVTSRFYMSVMEISAILVGLIAILLTTLVQWLRRGEIKGIPQPAGNYVFGHVLQLGGNFCQTFLQWKKSLGPVIQLRLLNTRVVVFNDRESIAKVCALPEASGRARNGLLLKAFKILGEGVTTSDGPLWEEQREFYTKAFRTFGVGCAETELNLQYEIQENLEDWKRLNGAPFELEGCNTAYVFNAFWTVLTGTRLQPSAIQALTQHMDNITRIDRFAHKLAFVSADLAEKFTDAVEIKLQGLQALANVGNETVLEHKKDWSPKQPRDVIDQILDKVHTATDPTSFYHQNNLKPGCGIGELISASIDTTSRTLEWLMLGLLRSPEAAAKLYAEIDQVLGEDSSPTLAHRDQMPYTQACIWESLRIGSVGAFGGVPRRALGDFEFNGSVIPEGTILIMNLYGVHYDTEVWDQPGEFRPERFLTPGGDQIDQGAKNKIVPFGIGRRMCLGNAIALDSMFLYVANVYQKFRFELVGGKQSTDGERFGLIRYPPEGVRMRAMVRQ